MDGQLGTDSEPSPALSEPLNAVDLAKQLGSFEGYRALHRPLGLA